MAVERLVFVYDADGTVAGEVRYWVSTLFGAEHCSLCDLTHTRWRRRPDFRACAARLAVPIEERHRDDVPEALAAVVVPPCVVAVHTDGTARRVLGPDELAAFAGDVAAFEAALRAAVTEP